MRRIRAIALCLGLGLTMTTVSAEPAAKTLAEVHAATKQIYDAALQELAARGAKAKAAAETGDAAKWHPTNDAYTSQLTEIVGICERNITALTHDATDLETTGAKPIVDAFSQYAVVAGSMETLRLQLTAFGSLVARLPASDRATVLKTLAPKYYVGKS